MKRHIIFTISDYCDMIQYLLLKEESKAIISDIVNIIRYYGNDYAETVYMRQRDTLDPLWQKVLH